MEQAAALGSFDNAAGGRGCLRERVGRVERRRGLCG